MAKSLDAVLDAVSEERGEGVVRYARVELEGLRAKVYLLEQNVATQKRVLEELRKKSTSLADALEGLFISVHSDPQQQTRALLHAHDALRCVGRLK